MMVGTRLGLPVAKVTTTVATHSPRPPRNIRSQGRLLHHPWVWVRVLAMTGTASGIVCVMAPLLVLGQGSRQDRPVSSQPAAISPAGWLESRAARYQRRRYRSSPATRLMVVARMTAPSRYDSSAAARNAEVWSAVSDT